MTSSHSQTSEELTPLQKTIYHFLKTSKQTYDKNQLMIELNLSHKSSFTRSLNQLMALNLIHLDESNNHITMTRRESTQDQSKKESLVKTLTESMPTQLSLLPSTEEESTDKPVLSAQSIEILTNVENTTSAKSLIARATDALSSALSNPDQEQLPIAAEPLPDLTETEKPSESISKILTPILTQTEEKNPIHHTSTQTSSLPSNQERATQQETTPNTTLHPLEIKFQGLNKNTKKLMRLLLRACLSHESWYLTNYRIHLTKEHLESNQLNERLKMLERAGFIKISGSKNGRLTFQQSPLDLCQHLPSFQNFLSENKQSIQLIHERYLEELKPKPTSSDYVVLKKSTSGKDNSSTPQASTSELPTPTVSFEKRYFLLDSENCNHFLSNGTWLKGLKETDSFLIFLSQNSPSIKPSMFHFFQQYKNQIETRYTTVRGKGESDLDHVLTMELAYLWMKDPDAQYIILSKDQGFLAAVDYWTQRHDLKKHQLCLKNTI